MSDLSLSIRVLNIVNLIPFIQFSFDPQSSYINNVVSPAALF